MVSLFDFGESESNHPFPVEGEQSQPPARNRTAEYGFLGPRACPTAELRQFKEMVSPQKHDEQRGARDHIQLARQPLASHLQSQAGDAPKPADSATDAVASGDNSAALEAGLAARQDAFQGPNAEAGGPASGNPFSDTIAPDPDEPRFAGVQADELTTKYFGNTEAQPRRVARLDLEAGPNADFHPGMPLAEDLSIKMREADRGEHALEELDDARARTSGASSAKAARDASAGDRYRVSFSPDSYESIKSVNLLLGHKPPGPMQPSKGNITSANRKNESTRTLPSAMGRATELPKGHEILEE